ncbi:hypothetical protein [Streptomyces lasiicapitis]|uniref:Uncharacterized protein n=1 Tax=Streptomyces lasiicapitis TaxID=1923961 RepID=A0ABQ2MVT5_9ACTN|nr:hypothetical protein [Streptomyces lasiicapitis]GGO58830.1 hypothetical protein GCM10012286_79020 [Streptomyces lasiicapitis]
MPDPQRYRVTLTRSGTRIAQGWWGDHGGRPGTRIELAERDGDEWRVLKSWP